jgi:hypothetical protein
VAWIRRSGVLGVLLCLGVLAAAATALAQDGGGADGDDQIVLTGRLLVPDGETVKTAVIFNGDATIDGTVTESLVVFNGNTEITGTVEDDVIVFNGDLVLRSGSRVGGDVVSIDDPQVEDGAVVEGSIDNLPTRWDVYDVTFVGRFVWWLAYTVSSLILGLLLLGLAPRLDHASVRALRDRLGGTIGFGFLVLVLLPIVAILLVVTIVGIPLGLFLFLALALLYTIGYVVGASALGRLVVKPPTSRFLAFLAGWGALRLLALVPFLGGISWLLATVVGLGTLWVAGRSARSGPPPVAEPVALPPTPAPPS